MKPSVISYSSGKEPPRMKPSGETPTRMSASLGRFRFTSSEPCYSLLFAGYSSCSLFIEVFSLVMRSDSLKNCSACVSRLES